MKLTKRLLALLLVMAMMLSNLSVAAYATETAETVPETAAAETVAETTAPAVTETEAPTVAPTEAPVEESTEAPTEAPVEESTEAATEAPTEAAEEKPTEAPTEAATEPVEATEEAITEPVLEAEPTTITLWSYPISGVFATQSQLEALVAPFEAATGIQVEVTCLNYVDGDNMINQAIANDTAPDIVIEGPERLVSNWGAQGHMVDLSDLTAGVSFYPNVLEACTASNGAVYQYPITLTTHCMAINKTVFEKAGAMQYIDQDTHTWTTENFFKAMEAVYQYTGSQVGVVFCGGQGGDQATRALVTNLYGGSYTDAGHTRYTWDSESMVAALQALKDCEALSFDPGIMGGDEIALFRQGTLNVAFCWNIAQQKQNATTNNGDEILFMAFPTPNGTDSQLQGGVWGFGIMQNNDEAKIAAAKQFVEYFGKGDGAVAALEATEYLPVRADMANVIADDALLAEYNKLSPMLGDYYQVTPNWGNARAQWYTMLQEIANGTEVATAAAKYTAYANGEDYNGGSGDSGEDNNEHPAMLTYRWLNDNGEGWGLDYFDPSWSSEGFNGWGWGMQWTPVEDVFLAFYLNTWNESTNSYESTPVHVEAGPYLTLHKMKGDPNFSIRPGAEDSDYYYFITVDDSAWNKTTSYTYHYNGQTLSIQVDLVLPESGMYTGPEMTPETYTPHYAYSQTAGEAVLYYGYRNDYWTLKDVSIEVDMDTINGYDPADAISTERLANGMYKITLDPWFVEAALWANLHVIGTLEDSQGNIQTTDYWHWLNCDIGARNIDAALTIDGRWYEFKEENGNITSYSYEVDESRTFEDGSPVVLYKAVSLPAGVSYQPSINTIMLNNANLSQLWIANYWDVSMNGQMLPNENVTIQLFGTSTISNDSDSALMLENVNLTFTGSGSLNLRVTNSLDNRDEHDNARSFNTIQMNDHSTLTIAGSAHVVAEMAGEAMQTHFEGDTCLGDYTAWLDVIQGSGDGILIIKDSAYFETVLPEGACANGPKVDNPLWGMDRPGGYRGLADMQLIEVRGGTLVTQEVIMNAHWDDRTNTEIAGEYHQSGGTVTITPIGGISETEKWVWNEETQQDENLGIVNYYFYNCLGSHEGSGLIEITGGTLNISADIPENELAESAGAEGIFTSPSGSINISGGNINIDLTAGSGIRTGTLNISGGTVDVTMHDDHDALYANYAMNISGGTVKAGRLNANDCDVTISGTANVTVDNMVVGFWWIMDDPNRPGNSDGSLTVNGGTLNVNGDLGLWPCSNGVDINGGTVNFKGDLEGGISGFAPLSIGGNAKVNFEGNRYWFNHSTATIADNALITVIDSDIQVHDSINDDGSIVSEGKFIMDGGKLVINATRTDPEHIERVMYFGNNSEMILNGGEIEVTATLDCDFPDDWNSAVNFDIGTALTINGGTFTVNSQDYYIGAWIQGAFNMNDGVFTVTNTNKRDGITVSADGNSVTDYISLGMCVAGYTTIDGGELNITGSNALDMAASGPDPSVDWPGNPNVKFVLNNGTINVNGTMRGVSAYSPIELNGGSLNVHISGMLNPYPQVNKIIGQALNLWYNDFEEAPTYMTINGGNHSFVADMGDNYNTYGAIVDLAKLTINGGNVRFEGTFAITGMNGRDSEDVLYFGDGMYVIDNNTGRAKDMITGTYVHTYQDETGAEQTRDVHINAFTEDNELDPEAWWYGEEDECSSLTVTSDYEHDFSKDPALTYKWIDNVGDDLYRMQPQDNNENNGKYGHSHMRRVPHDGDLLIFFLNVWNEKTQTWDATPVIPTPGKYLSMQKMSDLGYKFAEDAEYTDYYYEVSISEDAWDKETKFTYTYQGETLEVIVEIRRDDAGWYSAPTMSNATYLDHEFLYSQLKPETNVFYFGYDVSENTLKGVTFTHGNTSIPGYDKEKSFTVEKISDVMYKVTLDPELVSYGTHGGVQAVAHVTDPNGYSYDEWTYLGFYPKENERNVQASIGINGTGYDFIPVDGVVKSFTHTKTDLRWDWGGEVYAFGPAQLPAGVSYDVASNTLTLHNANIQSLYLSYRWYDENTGESGTDLPNENLTVKLIGTSTITGFGEDQPGVHIYNDVNVAFSGDGTLNIENTYPDAEPYPASLNIHSGADVYINGATINVTDKLGFNPGENWYTAVYLARDCSLTVNSGALSIHSTGYNTTFHADGDITINNGTVNITNVNEKAGLYYNEATDSMNNIWAGAMTATGKTTIYGGTLNLTGWSALELSYNAGNPDEGIEPNNDALFTMHGGKLNLNGQLIALDACIPAVVKGGSINAHATGTWQPVRKFNVGYALETYNNGMIDSYFNIEGGSHTFTGSFGENKNVYAAVAASSKLNITGGTVLFKAPMGVVSETMEADTKLLNIADGLYIIDQITGKAKTLVSTTAVSKGTDQEGNPVERTFYVSTVTKDDTLDGEKYMNGEHNPCTTLLITKDYTEPSTDTKLENASEALTDPEEIRDVIQNMDSEDLENALMDPDSADDLAALEEKCTDKAPEIVYEQEQSPFQGGDSSIIGAGLNDVTDKDESVKLIVDDPSQDNQDKIGAEYDPAKTIQFSMTLTNVTNPSELAVPVKITLPLPAGLNPQLAVVLHFNAKGEPELVLSTTFQDGTQWYISMVVSGFSDFAITEVTNAEASLTRIAGDGRCQTAMEAAEELKKIQGVEKFRTILVADGNNYPDALSGSYLAAVADAPILLVQANQKKVTQTVKEYILSNLTADATVYILGGTNSIPTDFETSIRTAGYTVKRLAGNDRYLTSLMIIQEGDALLAQQGKAPADSLLVCAGGGYADSLSASATGRPVLLVNGGKTALTTSQKTYLDSIGKRNIYIIGGPNSVSNAIATQLNAYDTDGITKRIAGDGREETSAKVAQEFFPNATFAVLADGNNYPDGLSGGPVAYAKQAPLLLIRAKRESYAKDFVGNRIKNGYIMGGPNSVSDASAKVIFGADTQIK